MDFTTVQKGKLSFKTDNKRKKKKKKKKRKKEELKKDDEAQADDQADKKQKIDGKKGGKEDEIDIEAEIAGMTESEKNFIRAQAKLEQRMINQKIKKTHREKIKEFNAYLGNLTEHYDIPRVGPG
mmetsp:Transcript_11306/g.15657  ORF Transcript_11306/g.15657 Transcript_11306/m.15657 type:complete len:125 (+) Transcript_11306:107-481(+)|eukprot:CAMPEP_0185255686 /NCGR_PEP_ID=MMETSP1359-20130426/4768_1 /TAXON_ID=552665 /ORGANISM="Bigelowiella longifila, Strain CCMP242" /LENGTH=124 /DNA_ID=CAMNT_0027839807 /DNA_START=106 /DNA_END=480 /DNA_ORIENTATION=-